jgi:hypothetical protein
MRPTGDWISEIFVQTSCRIGLPLAHIRANKIPDRTATDMPDYF